MVKAGDVDDSAELLEVVNEAVTRYGAVNDRIVAYERAKERDDDDDDADEIADEIADAWADLLEWQDDADLDEVLDDLQATVRK